MRQWAERSPTWWRVLASPLAMLFALLVALRNFLFDLGALSMRRLPRPAKVWSIGNLVAGGTGKSPIVIATAEWLRAKGARPAILTRGYGSNLASGDSLALLDGAEIMKAKGQDRKSTRLNSSHIPLSRMPSSA